MSWTVILEDENKKAIESLNEEFSINDLDTLPRGKFKLLIYLDPYGDTIFNSIQIPDLISDLAILGEDHPNPRLITEVIILAKKSLQIVHSYLVFYGD